MCAFHFFSLSIRLADELYYMSVIPWQMVMAIILGFLFAAKR